MAGKIDCKGVQAYKQVVVHYLNLIFGVSEESTVFWCGKFREQLLAKYPMALTQQEIDKNYCLRKSCDFIGI